MNEWIMKCHSIYTANISVRAPVHSATTTTAMQKKIKTQYSVILHTNQHHHRRWRCPVFPHTRIDLRYVRMWFDRCGWRAFHVPITHAIQYYVARVHDDTRYRQISNFKRFSVNFFRSDYFHQQTACPSAALSYEIQKVVYVQLNFNFIWMSVD